MIARPGQSRRAAAARCLALLLLTAACQSQPAAVPVPPIRVVDIGRAVSAFQAICLQTAPAFRQARERFASHGLVDERNEGIVYDDSGTLSVRINVVDTARGPQLRCSIVYEDPNRFVAEERIDAMVRAAPGRVRRSRSARFPARDGSVRQGRAWSYTTGGRTGDLLDVPYSGRSDLGVLILQFPALR